MTYDPTKFRSRITSMRVSNFRSLGDPTSLDFGDLTVLVGPNGSGKSNICDALRFLADTTRIGLEAAFAKRHGLAAVRRWSSGRPNDVSFLIEVSVCKIEDSSTKQSMFDCISCLYGFSIGGSKTGDFQIKKEHAYVADSNGFHEDLIVNRNPERTPKDYLHEYIIENRVWTLGPSDLRPQVTNLSLALPLIAGDERFQPLADALRNISIYSIFPDTLREPQKPDYSKPMNEHGTNWCSILKSLREEPEAEDLIAALGQLTGDIDDFRVAQAAGYLVTEFRHGQSQSTGSTGKTRPRWFGASQESDGTLRMAGILTALLQQPTPTLIGIEEPELTIHPGALPLLYDHIKEASKRGQVILTTHSPDLLALLEADEVRVVERRDGVTTVAPMEESQRQAVHDQLFNPGELLRMEGLKQARLASLPEEL